MRDLPTTIYIENNIRSHPFTNRILSKLPNVPTIYVDDYKKIGELKYFKERADQDKNALAIAEKKGELVKSIGRMEQDQFYLFHEIDCKYDCEYCYLQYYFQTKVPVVFVNRDQVLLRIEEILQTTQNPYFHVGEVCDALALDELTGFSLDIAELFKRYPNGTVEFRTKSANIKNLLSIPHPPANVIPSWTLNPQRVIEGIEHKTPSLTERIGAAAKCQEAGYTVGVRLDPIIMIECWEKDYEEMVTQIFSSLDLRKIDHITLGTLKLHKLLIDAMRKRYPQSLVLSGELFPSADGKSRYLKFQRAEMYRKIIKWIREFDRDIEIQFSLESDEIHSQLDGATKQYNRPESAHI